MAEAAVPADLGDHLAADLVPPAEHGVLPGGGGLLVRSPARIRQLERLCLEEPLQPQLAAGGAGAQQVLRHPKLQLLYQVGGRSGSDFSGGNHALLFLRSGSTELLAGGDTVPCTAWEHDTSFWRATIIMEFDLVCQVVWPHCSPLLLLSQRYPLRKLQQQVTFLGLMCGVFTAGLISDRSVVLCTVLVRSYYDIAR